MCGGQEAGPRNQEIEKPLSYMVSLDASSGMNKAEQYLRLVVPSFKIHMSRRKCLVGLAWFKCLLFYFSKQETLWAVTVGEKLNQEEIKVLGSS